MRHLLTFAFCYVYLIMSAQTGSLTIHFDNVVGKEDMALDSKTYKNALGEEFNISLFQYYVSNIRLVRADGSEYVVPQDDSYFLIREHEPETHSITLNNVPNGKYASLRFLIGIDSLRNTADLNRRTGCLDVGGAAQDMYWAWNSGYIFVKMEGTSPQVELKAGRVKPIFMYHIGLYGGMGDKKTLNNIKQTEVGLGAKKLKVKNNQPYLVLKTDALHLLNGPTNISFAENPTVMAGPFSANIAENYRSMFSLGSLSKRSPAGPDTKTAMK